MSEAYAHPGWVGAPYESDFHARWGLIRRRDMLDCRTARNVSEAAAAAQAKGLSYIIAPRASKAGNRLYRVGGGAPRCVFSMLDYQMRNAARGRERYRGDIVERAKQLVRVAKTRAEAKGIPFELDQGEIVARLLLGRCEATGLPLDLVDAGTRERRNAFAPSLDQIEASAGYTAANVQVTCLAWNLMKSTFPASQARQFILAAAASLVVPEDA